MRPSRRAPEGRYGRYRTPNWGPEEPTAPGTLAALESLRPLGVEPPQTERTDRLLRSLQVETGGVGQRHRAISTPHELWVGRYERTGHEYVHVRPLF